MSVPRTSGSADGVSGEVNSVFFAVASLSKSAAAPPDSARLDFFLAGGLGGGRAVLVGDDLSAPGGAMVDRLVPPAPLMWGALGRLAVPPVADTAAAWEEIQDGRPCLVILHARHKECEALHLTHRLRAQGHVFDQDGAVFGEGAQALGCCRRSCTAVLG